MKNQHRITGVRAWNACMTDNAVRLLLYPGGSTCTSIGLLVLNKTCQIEHANNLGACHFNDENQPDYSGRSHGRHA